MRRLISPLEYRHLRVWAGVRFAIGIFHAGFGAFMLYYGFYGWAALLLVAAAVLFSVAYLEMTVARSEPPRS
jgi:hypothetical protein